MKGFYFDTHLHCGGLSQTNYTVRAALFHEQVL